MDQSIALLIDSTGCTHEAAERALEALVEHGWRRPAPVVKGEETSAAPLTGDAPLQAYTDGACSGNPGPGGWAVVFARQGAVIAEHSGPAGHTTNNRAELTAVREAVRHAPPEAALEIVTDSQGVIGWLSKGWKRNVPEIAALCREIEALAGARPGGWSFTHVRGHAGHVLNERADKLAVAAGRSAAA